jgi:phosphatidylinositol glycan class S
VVATLGLPHWIWTTSIHREELPVEEMARWAEGNVSVLG